MSTKKIRKIAWLAVVMLLTAGCGAVEKPVKNSGVGVEQNAGTSSVEDKKNPTAGNQENTGRTEEQSTPVENNSEEKQVVDVYAGYSENAPADFSKVVITCLEGTGGCYTTQGNTLTFTNVAADSVYAVSGEFKGNIVIDTGDDYKFDLELHGLSFSSDNTNPIFVKSGDEVTITAKKGYQNYIYDMRTMLAEDSAEKAGAIYSDVDLKIAGKGELVVVSENNNGIHSKKDLEVKNLTLTVHCTDNALKGNDSVTLENAATTLIATMGDGIKTTRSDISGKGKQRGAIAVQGGTHTIYAACDGLDAAYDVVVEEDTTTLTVYTDKYSDYSEEVTAVAEDVYYIRFNSKVWNYSVKYYNSDDDFVWVTPEFHSTVSGGRTSDYYYSFPKMEEYAKLQLFIYSDDMQQGQENEYLAATEYLSLNDGYDTLALFNRGNNLSYSWTNYSTKASEGFGRGPGAPGGMGGPGGWAEGNTEKGDHSTKGIKAANEIIIQGGTVSVTSYDDAFHASNDTTLENGQSPKGNIRISGGMVSLYSNDDGLHADGTVTVTDGVVTISNSYEGIEGTMVQISGGNVSVTAKDDGINATTTKEAAVTVSGGELYICCTGDGIDSNSRTAYNGIVFSGGNTVILTTSGMNSAIDTEKGYQYTGGKVLALMPAKGMSQEALHCENFAEIGSKKTTAVIKERYLTVSVAEEDVVSIQMPEGLSAMVVYLGSNDAVVSVSEECTATLNTNGVSWYK